jgi:hypothetical protein
LFGQEQGWVGTINMTRKLLAININMTRSRVGTINMNRNEGKIVIPFAGVFSFK